MENLDINGLDVKTLRLLIAIDETGSVSRGAEARGMTQSTASYALDKLRAAFRDPLFIRQSRGVTPTARGEQIIEGCREALARLDTLAAANHFDPATETRDFTIAATAYEIETVVAPLRRDLSRSAPHCRLIIRGMDIKNLEERLAHDWDLALMSDPTDSPHLKRVLLFEDHYVTFYDPEARDAPDTLEAFRQAPHALATLGGKTSSVIDKELAKSGHQRHVALVVDGFESLPSLMRDSDLITTLPRRIGEALMRGYAFVPCPLLLAPLPIHAVWQVKKDTEAGHRWLRERIRSASRRP